MTHSWRTAWQGQDIIVFRDDLEIDRIPAAQIERILFVYRGHGDSVGDLAYSVVEMASDVLVLPADTGFSGRINFERLDYWASRECVHWVALSQAKLPLRLRRSHWWLGPGRPSFTRVPREELRALIDSWPLEGPQTWYQRKWRRIEQRRPFSGPEAEPGRARRA